MSRLRIGLALAALALAALPAAARKGGKGSPPACPPGVYVLDSAEGLGPAALPALPDSILLDGAGRLSVESSCPPVPGKVKGTRRGTRLKAKWPKEACAELAGKVTLKARTDPTCQTLEGTFRARKHKRSFTATRSFDVSAEPDTERRSAAHLGPEGGSVSATGADGTLYTLTLPEGALAAETEIALTPVARIADLPFEGGLVGAAQFEPEGLVLFEPGTLGIEPPGGIAPPDGQRLAGFDYLGSGGGFGLGFATTDGVALLLPVHHFSGAGGGFAAPGDLERAISGGRPGSGFLAEFMATGAEPDPALRLALAAETYENWYRTLIRPRLQAGVLHDAPLSRAVVELAFWQSGLESGGAAASIDVDAGELLGALASALEDAHSLLADALRQAIARANARCLARESFFGAEDALRWMRIGEALLSEDRLFAEELDEETVLSGLCLQIVFEELSFPQQPILGEPEPLHLVAGYAFGDGRVRLRELLGVQVFASAALPAISGGQTDARGRYQQALTPTSGAVELEVSVCLGTAALGLRIGDFPRVASLVCQSAFIVRGLVVTPRVATLAPGGTQQFAAERGSAPVDVVWTASGGSIDGTGLFTAPGPGRYTVTATAVGDAGLVATAEVIVEEDGGSGGLPSGPFVGTVTRFNSRCLAPGQAEIEANSALSGPGTATVSSGSIVVRWNPPPPFDGFQETLVSFDGSDIVVGSNRIRPIGPGSSGYEGTANVSATAISGGYGVTGANSSCGDLPHLEFDFSAQ